MATELLDERAKCNFDMKELEDFINLIPDNIKAHYEKVKNDVDNDPELQLTHKYYEMTPEEIQQMWMRKMNRLYKIDRKTYFETPWHVKFYWCCLFHGQPPIGLHSSMFMQSVE